MFSFGLHTLNKKKRRSHTLKKKKNSFINSTELAASQGLSSTHVYMRPSKRETLLPLPAKQKKVFQPFYRNRVKNILATAPQVILVSTAASDFAADEQELFQICGTSWKKALIQQLGWGWQRSIYCSNKRRLRLSVKKNYLRKEHTSKAVNLKIYGFFFNKHTSWGS